MNNRITKRKIDLKKSDITTYNCYYFETTGHCVNKEHVGGTGPYEGYSEEWWDVKINEAVARDGTSVDPHPVTSNHVHSTASFTTGEAGWLVYAVYSSGSTFGMCHDKYIQAVGIFNLKDLISAKVLQETCLKITGEERTPYIIFTPDKQRIEIDPSWTGYFDRLTAIRIEKINVF